METTQSPSPRTPLLISVSFRKNYAREEMVGNLKNISLTGAFLSHGGEDLQSGDKLYMTFNVSGRERTLSAQVIWSKGSGCGLKFTPTNKRDTQIIDDLIYFVENKRVGSRDILDKIFTRVA
jgi:hypothetical protein